VKYGANWYADIVIEDSIHLIAYIAQGTASWGCTNEAVGYGRQTDRLTKVIR
jgi:hypothetical protein